MMRETCIIYLARAHYAPGCIWPPVHYTASRNRTLGRAERYPGILDVCASLSRGSTTAQTDRNPAFGILIQEPRQTETTPKLAIPSVQGKYTRRKFFGNRDKHFHVLQINWIQCIA